VANDDKAEKPKRTSFRENIKKLKLWEPQSSGLTGPNEASDALNSDESS
jgi:hypothetical protein